MTTPVRPSKVPESARYDAEGAADYHWVVGDLDTDGKEHGHYKTYADAGYVHAECTFVHGSVEGDNIVYHPDGSIASVGEWRGGKCYDAVFHRAKGESPEPFPDDVDARVMTIRYVATPDAKANRQVLYFDAQGNEVTTAGEPMPPRPAGVDEDARFFPTRGLWMMGGVMRGASPKQVGVVKHWSSAGVPQLHEEYDADGLVLSKKSFHADGKLYVDKRFEGGKCVFEERWRESGTLRSRRLSDVRGRETFAGTYDVDGQATEEKTTRYEGDALEHHHHDAQGKRVAEIERDGGGHRCRLYEDGLLLADGRVDGGTLAGEWQIFEGGAKVRTRFDATALEIKAKLSHEALSNALRIAAFRELEPKLAAVPALAQAKDVPWEKLEGAYGNGAGFDTFLRALTSTEPLVQRYALGQIYSQALHQGSVYACTAAVMPFMIRLLEVPTAPRTDVLHSIHDFAAAAASYVSDAEKEVENPEEGEPADWARTLLAIVDAVGEGWPTIATLVERGTPREQSLVITLAGLARGRPELAGELRRLSREATTPEMRALAVHALSRRKGTEPAELAPCLADKDPLVRMTAAIAAGLQLGPRAPAGADEQLAEALVTLSAEREEGGLVGLARRYYALPFVDGHPLAFLSLAAGSIRTERCFAMAKGLCALSEALDGVSASDFGRGLLALSFGRCDKPFMPGFVDVLAALAKSEKFFAFNVNAAEVCRSFGLPGTAVDLRESLADLVSKLRASDDPEALLYGIMHANDAEDEEDDAEDEEDDEEDEEDDEEDGEDA